MLHEIDKLAWLYVKDGQLLVARSRGQDVYYIPGGKREENESDEQALIREIKEELTVDLKSETIHYAATFKAQAQGKPDGVQVKTSCYFAAFTGTLQASAEIAEIGWVRYADKMKCSPVTQMIMDWLAAQKQSLFSLL